MTPISVAMTETKQRPEGGRYFRTDSISKSFHWILRMHYLQSYYVIVQISQTNRCRKLSEIHRESSSGCPSPVIHFPTVAIRA
jgi:hypothetical protein